MEKDLRKRMRESIDGKTLNYCFSCGMCTGVCPSARATDSEYNPRQIIHRAVVEGKLEDDIWLCTSCFSCNEICPTETRVADLVNLMRRIYSDEIGIPEHVKPLIENLGECGFTQLIGEYENKKRDRLGLPKLKHTPEIKTILEKTGGDL